MKRIFLSLFVCSFTTSLFAQFLVESNGNVAVKPTSDPVASYFTVNHAGASDICSYIFSDNSSMDVGMRVTKNYSTSSCHNYNTGIYSDVISDHNSIKKTYGLYTHAHKESGDSNSGRSFGVYAVAGNSVNGYNYGVLGCLSGENVGAGVFGSAQNWEGGMTLSARFAGLFHGNVMSTDVMYAAAYNLISDYRLKENIESIDTESIDKILKLNVVKYNLKQLTIDTGDTATTQEYYYTNDSKLLEKKHYGLIAQELKEIYPDLVYESGNGYLSVNYIELVPILIKSIQELTSKIDALEKDNKAAKSKQSSDEIANKGGLNLQTILYQNDPNPFTENTIIRCFIPYSINKAILYLYDLNGHQVENIAINERGDVSLTIGANSLDAGMYLYSLITDGVASDTKRMILTK